eukprot:364481-Chlamydomonas_euryale.AAC.17
MFVVWPRTFSSQDNNNPEIKEHIFSFNIPYLFFCLSGQQVDVRPDEVKLEHGCVVLRSEGAPHVAVFKNVLLLAAQPQVPYVGEVGQGAGQVDQLACHLLVAAVGTWEHTG